jgi:hypothetical protein
MSALPQMLHDSALTAAASALLYTATIAITALTAVLARYPPRRRAALQALELLLRRHTKTPDRRTHQPSAVPRISSTIQRRQAMLRTRLRARSTRPAAVQVPRARSVNAAASWRTG